MNSAALSQMESSITCANCLQIYQDPRNMPCGHTICYKCYESEYQLNNRCVKCATCDKTHRLQPNKLAVSATILSVIDSYNMLSNSLKSSLQQQQEDRPQRQQDINVPGSCGFPGCNKTSIQLGPQCLMKLCKIHYDKDMSAQTAIIEQLEEYLDTQIGPKGCLTKATESTDFRIATSIQLSEEVHSVFGQLKKAVKMKEEDLLASVDNQERILKEEMETLKDKLEFLSNKRYQMRNLMRNQDYKLAHEVIRQLQTYKTTNEKIVVSGAPGISMKLELLSKRINRLLDKCVPAKWCGHDTMEDFAESIKEEESDIGKIMGEFTLNQQVSYLTVCTNTVGYYHNPSVTNVQSSDVNGCVEKGKSNDQCIKLPNEIIICGLTDQDDNNYLGVYSTEGTQVSSICFNTCFTEEYAYQYTTLTALCCNSDTQLLLFSCQSQPNVLHICNLSCSEQICSITVSTNCDFPHYIFGAEFCLKPPATVSEYVSADEVESGRCVVFSVSHMINRMMKTTSTANLSQFSCNGTNQFYNNNSFYGTDTNSIQLSIHTVSKNSSTIIGSFYVQDVWDVTCTYDQIYLLQGFETCVLVHDAASSQQLKKISINNNNVRLIELDIDYRGILFVKDANGNIYCFGTEEGSNRLLGRMKVEVGNLTHDNFNRFCAAKFGNNHWLFDIDGSGTKLRCLNIAIA